MPLGGEGTAKRGRTITTMGQLFGSTGPAGGSELPTGAGSKRDRTLSTFGQLFQSLGVDAGRQYVPPPVEPAIGRGRGKKKPYSPIPYSGWYERRTKEREEKARAALAAALEELEEEERKEAEKPENILYEAEQRIAKQIADERASRAAKEEQRLKAFTALEMIGKPKETTRERKKSQLIAKAEARRREADWRRKKDRENGIKKQRLLNLEKAKLAKAAKEKRQEEIRQQRLENLKKARAAKKRKAKKKKK